MIWYQYLWLKYISYKVERSNKLDFFFLRKGLLSFILHVFKNIIWKKVFTDKKENILYMFG